MAPNLKHNFNLPQEHELLLRPDEAPNDKGNAELTDLLDKQADTDGLKSMNADAEDWTDVKHSERKKRDRILDGKSCKPLCNLLSHLYCVVVLFHIMTNT